MHYMTYFAITNGIKIVFLLNLSIISITSYLLVRRLTTKQSTKQKYNITVNTRSTLPAPQYIFVIF